MILLKVIITFIILFLLFMFFALIYHEKLSNLKNIVRFKFNEITKIEIIYSLVISLLLSGLLTWSCFN